MAVPADLTLADYIAIQTLVYQWAESYDTKDWNLLKNLLGPVVRLDARYIGGQLHENLTPDQFVAIIADRKVIGDPLVKTQHLIGGGSWSFPGDGTIQVWWQLRAAHQRFAAADMLVSVNKGHGHGANQHTYKKLDGTWKIVGINPRLDWMEGDVFGTINPPEAA